ncbi:unnamed protein product [Ambrosiozyma monospora]|uniref:Unnamed protein product n=2 Tax=Ambrosiozyma monospora TaxID=43982 RepID=A0ACB5SZ39_AMBMO|nr:unnamed protein product [Ambrosiozyma monospora]
MTTAQAITINIAKQVASSLPLDLQQLIFKYVIEFNISSAAEICQLIGVNKALDYSVALVLTDTVLMSKYSFNEQSDDQLTTEYMTLKDYTILENFLIPRSLRIQRYHWEYQTTTQPSVFPSKDFLDNCCSFVCFDCRSVTEPPYEDISRFFDSANLIHINRKFSFRYLENFSRLETVCFTVTNGGEESFNSFLSLREWVERDDSRKLKLFFLKLETPPGIQLAHFFQNSDQIEIMHLSGRGFLDMNTLPYFEDFENHILELCSSVLPSRDMNLTFLKNCNSLRSFSLYFLGDTKGGASYQVEFTTPMLQHLVIYSIPSTNIKFSFGNLPKLATLFCHGVISDQLLKEIPSSISKLNIFSNKLRPDIFSAKLPDKLRVLSIEDQNPHQYSLYDLSYLPQRLLSLSVQDQPEMFHHEFPNSLRQLDINLSQYTDTFHNFWNRYITCLPLIDFTAVVSVHSNVFSLLDIVFPDSLKYFSILLQKSWDDDKVAVVKIGRLPMNLHRFEIDVDLESGNTCYKGQSGGKSVLLQVLGDDSINDFKKLVEVGSNIVLESGAAGNFAEVSSNEIS